MGTEFGASSVFLRPRFSLQLRAQRGGLVSFIHLPGRTQHCVQSFWRYPSKKYILWFLNSLFPLTLFSDASLKKQF